MAAGTLAIWPNVINDGWCAPITAVNTALDGTGTVSLVATAGLNGSHFPYIILKPSGANIATVARFWVNNGSTPTVATNNTFLCEVSLPASSASSVAAMSEVVVNLDTTLRGYLKASYRVYMSIGTAVVAGWSARMVGGDY